MPARHKGIHSDAFLDEFWPHHAVVPRENCCGENCDPAQSWARDHGYADRMAHLTKAEAVYLAFPLKDEQAAAEMVHLVGGETYSALERGKPAAGKNGARSRRTAV